MLWLSGWARRLYRLGFDFCLCCTGPQPSAGLATSRAPAPRRAAAHTMFWQRWTWTPAHTDKLVHLCLGGALLSLSSRLVNQRHKMEDEQAAMQQQLDDVMEDGARRRQRLLDNAPALAASAGLSASASTQFAAALRALDAEPLPVIVAADAVQRPPSIDPRETVTREADKKAVAIY